jgi:hypothetical protein
MISVGLLGSQTSLAGHEARGSKILCESDKCSPSASLVAGAPEKVMIGRTVTGTILGITAAIIALLLLCPILVFFVLHQCRSSHTIQADSDDEIETTTETVLTISFDFDGHCVSEYDLSDSLCDGDLEMSAAESQEGNSSH